MQTYIIYYNGTLNHWFEQEVEASSREEAWKVFDKLASENRGIAEGASAGHGNDLGIRLKFPAKNTQSV